RAEPLYQFFSVEIAVEQPCGQDEGASHQNGHLVIDADERAGEERRNGPSERLNGLEDTESFSLSFWVGPVGDHGCGCGEDERDEVDEEGEIEPEESAVFDGEEEEDIASGEGEGVEEDFFGAEFAKSGDDENAGAEG